MISRMEKEVKDLKLEALRNIWLMRGGVSYDDAMFMSPQDRQLVSKIATENVDITKKTKLPYF